MVQMPEECVAIVASGCFRPSFIEVPGGTNLDAFEYLAVRMEFWDGAPLGLHHVLMQKHEPLFSVTAHISVKHVQKASEISIVFAVIQEKLSDFNDFFDTSHADSMDYRAMINLKGQF